MTDQTSNQTNPKRGGKRAGAGRKSEGKVKVSYKLAPDVVAYLNSRADKPKARIIEEALREHKENYEK